MNSLYAVTGTKGKTTIVRLLDYVFQQQGRQALRVDTSGAYLNGALRVSDQESRQKWGFAATNAPGRFLYLLDDADGVGILECTLFCANRGVGLGYKHHNIGIFTNVFEDHLGGSQGLETKQDIANKKSLVFEKIAPGGSAIYNIDDPLVVDQLQKVPSHDVRRMGVTLDDTAGDRRRCVVTDSEALLYDNGLACRYSLSDFQWLAAAHRPSRYAIGFAIAALYEGLDAARFDEAIQELKTYTFDEDGGRMVRIDTGGPVVLLDFAHEKYSLHELAMYARSLISSAGRVIGVVRLAPSRTKELIEDTAQFIAKDFDTFIVYDKVDGYWRQPALVKGFTDKYEEVGKVAGILGDALRAQGTDALVVLREDQAIQAAVKKARPDDAIVYIVNDDSRRSRKFLLQALQGYQNTKEKGMVE